MIRFPEAVRMMKHGFLFINFSVFSNALKGRLSSLDILVGFLKCYYLYSSKFQLFLCCMKKRVTYFFMCSSLIHSLFARTRSAVSTARRLELWCVRESQRKALARCGD